MKAFATIAILCLLLLAPYQASAAEPKCRLISTVAATSIAAGAFTTSAFPDQSSITSRSYPEYTYLKVGVDLVDANGSVTNIRLSFTSAEAYAGTYRTVPLCLDVSPTLTCGAVVIDWDPSTYGKNWWIKPVDWNYLFGKITVTPTGHGAGDTAALTIYGCWE